MNKIHEWVNTGLLAIAVVLIASVLVGGNQSVATGASGSRFPNGLSTDSTSPSAGQVRTATLTVTGAATADSITVDSAGTSVSRHNVGLCYIKAYATTIVGSSTVNVDCQGTAAVSASGMSALAGVTNGDYVVATLSTTTAAGGAAAPVLGGLVVTGAAASSTSGYIVLTIANLTGGTYTWPLTGQATGTAYYMVER